VPAGSWVSELTYPVARIAHDESTGQRTFAALIVASPNTWNVTGLKYSA